MVWTVKYIRKDGSQGTEEVNADTRTLAISEMRERGLRVVSIADGPKSGTKKKGGQSGVSALAMLLLLILLAVAGWWVWDTYFASGKVTEAVRERRQRPAKIDIRPVEWQKE